MTTFIPGACYYVVIDDPKINEHYALIYDQDSNLLQTIDLVEEQYYETNSVYFGKMMDPKYRGKARPIKIKIMSSLSDSDSDSDSYLETACEIHFIDRHGHTIRSQSYIYNYNTSPQHFVDLPTFLDYYREQKRHYEFDFEWMLANETELIDGIAEKWKEAHKRSKEKGSCNLI